MSSVVNTQNFINEFKNMINIEKNYTRLELNNIMKIAYDNIKVQKKKTNKKEPTKYNLFVKEYLSILKDENPDLSRQDLMSLVGEKWKTMKDTYNPKENNNETENKNKTENNNETKNNNETENNNKEEEVTLIPKKIENKKSKTVKKEKK